MLKEEIEFTILMPCLNEEATIAHCIEKAFESINKNKVSAEVLIADNGSTDRSIAIAEMLGVRIISVEEKGYGAALQAGIKNAKGKYIIMGDSDCSYDFGELSPFIEKLREGNELVMGNRFKGGIMKGAMPFLHRYLGNPVLSFIGRLFFQTSIGDFHCGLRGFNRQSILDIELNTKGMEFASEMVVKASLNKLKIIEVPTVLYPDGRVTAPHLRTWHDGWRHLRFLLIYSPKWLFLYPGIIMIIVGLIFSSVLTINQIHIGHINFDIHTLLYTLTLFYVGYQFVVFYMFSKYYGVKNKLLPASKFFLKLFKQFRLERGLLIGAVLLIAGMGLTLKAFLIWQGTGFGDLETERTIRLAIPAVFLILIGGQTILNSFFMSILQLESKQK